MYGTKLTSLGTHSILYLSLPIRELILNCIAVQTVDGSRLKSNVVFKLSQATKMFNTPREDASFH